VWAVGGWADAYTNAVPRLLAPLASPSRGLVGPWAHVYPQSGVPGPAIDFLAEALRWWERWLGGKDGGLDDEPRFRVWMPDSARGGRWVAETEWPSPRIVPTRYVLNPGRLDDAPAPSVALAWRSPETVGVAAGEWCPFGIEGDLPSDQAADDAGSLCFDSAPLAERLEILGAPVVVLHVAVDRPQALVAVRLNEIAPDGASTRVTYGVLNLTHRADHERVDPLEPGRRYEVRIVLNHVAHSFAPGARLRLAVTTGYWPIVWPSPAAVALTVFTGVSTLEVPVRPPAPEDARLRPFGAPETGAAVGYTELRPARLKRTLERRDAELVQTATSDTATRIEAIGLEMEHAIERRYRIRADDPLSAQATVAQRMGLRRGEWAVRVATDAELSATRDAWEGETLVATRRWERRIPRDGV
jgi:predicted acyl esterase